MSSPIMMTIIPVGYIIHKQGTRGSQELTLLRISLTITLNIYFQQYYKLEVHAPIIKSAIANTHSFHISICYLAYYLADLITH